MKQCLKCNQTYDDETLNFCLNDGEMLVQSYENSRAYSDPPPTVIMNDPRATNPTNWQQPAAPIGKWQAPVNMQNSAFGVPSFMASRDKTLPTIAMIVGILSLIMICCYGGFWLGLPAAIIGYLGMRNADSDPSRYDGRGLAIAGMVMGVVSFLGSIGMIILVIIGNLK